MTPEDAQLIKSVLLDYVNMRKLVEPYLIMPADYQIPSATILELRDKV